MKLFTVHDSKAAYHFNPIVHRNAGEAIRAFETAVENPESQFHKYPADFTLFEIGTFDVDTGGIKTYEDKILLVNASDLVKTKIN